jgi:hypothetical protein
MATPAMPLSMASATTPIISTMIKIPVKRASALQTAPDRSVNRMSWSRLLIFLS